MLMPTLVFNAFNVLSYYIAIHLHHSRWELGYHFTSQGDTV